MSVLYWRVPYKPGDSQKKVHIFRSKYEASEGPNMIQKISSA